MDESEYSEYYTKIELNLSTLQKLLNYLENNAYDKIHLNACCSSFDCEILNALEGVKSSGEVIKIIEQGKIYIPSN